MEMQFSGTVRDLTIRGLGVVDHPDRRVCFVPGVIPGDIGAFSVTKTEKNYLFGKMLELTEHSQFRINPPCQIHGHTSTHCHGCPWMMMDYAFQLTQKQKILEYQLNRNKLLSSVTQIHTIKASEKIYSYRNRAQFKTDGQVLGYVAAEDDKTIVDVKSCLILEGKPQEILSALRLELPNTQWRPGENYLWNFLDVDSEMLSADEVKINVRRPFMQGNRDQNTYMRSWLTAKIEALSPNQSVVELFAGSGNFTIPVAQCSNVKEVFAFEAAADAVSILNDQKLAKVRAEQTDLFNSDSLKTIRKNAAQATLLVLDPPRSGFRKLSHYAKELKSLSSIIYISCDISTFTFDAHMLLESGWQLVEVQPVDLFPHTPHVEILSLFKR